MTHRKPPGVDTLVQIKAVRERYARLSADIQSRLIFARNDPDRIPEYVARATINIKELSELIEQTFILPPVPVLVDIMRAYADLVVVKVQRGL